MCIVIDINNLGRVLDENNVEHSGFKPVLDWIVDGKGKIVYGGTKYEEELAKASRYIKLLVNLHMVHKIVTIDGNAVDEKEREIKQQMNVKDFDDQHIVAIIAVSGVRLICSGDKRAIKFFKNKAFYDKGKLPKIYSSKRNRILLSDVNIVECCQPAMKLNQSTKEQLGF